MPLNTLDRGTLPDSMPISFLPNVFLEYDNHGLLTTRSYDKRDEFNIPLVKFPFLCNNIPSPPAYGVCISQIIGYSRENANFQNCLQRSFLFTKKLLSQGFIDAKLRSGLRRKIIMQTVITWRRPRDAQRNLNYGNPCMFLIGNALCYIISGLILLVVGVIITSLTFQNLEHHDSENSKRYAGPILIVVGVLVLARGALSHLRPGDSANAQRLVIRSYTGEISTRPIMEFSSNSITMCSVSIAEAHEYPRLSIYNDDPPSYEAVVDATSERRQSDSTETETRDESTQSPDDQPEPPPSYEECVRSCEPSITEQTVT